MYLVEPDRGAETLNHWLEEIYRQHRRGLIGLARSVAGCDAAAEDAVHEACARLVRRGEPPAGDSAAYVYRAVRNAAVDQVRRRAANPAEAVEPERAVLFADPGPTADAAIELAERDRDLADAVQRLDGPQREVVLMKVFAALTFAQIAEVTGEPISTLSARYQRALARLKQILETRHATL